MQYMYIYIEREREGEIHIIYVRLGALGGPERAGCPGAAFFGVAY